jgi:hypothetical protein
MGANVKHESPGLYEQAIKLVHPPVMLGIAVINAP